MTAVPRCCAPTDDRRDNTDPFGLASPRPATAGPGHGGHTTPRASASVPGPARPEQHCRCAAGGCGRHRSHGREDRAHRSLENRKERGFPQRPQPIIFFLEIWKSTGPTSPTGVEHREVSAR